MICISIEISIRISSNINIIIDDINLEVVDVIGAFKNDLCVGWIDYDINGFTAVPVMGVEQDLYPNYMIEGEVPDFKFFDYSDDVYYDDGYNYPVHFSDSDRDGKLSAGDQFAIYGQGDSANGPAEDGWKLDIQFDASGDIIGSAKLL